MRKQFFTFSFFVLLVAILPNCGKYEPQTFRMPYEPPQEKNGISLQTHKLSKDEYREYFTPNKKLFGKDPVLQDFIPVQLLITNNTNKTYLLSGNNIAARLEMKQNIANKMHYKASYWPAYTYDKLGNKQYDATSDALNKSFRAKAKEQNKQIDRDATARIIDSNDEIKIRPGTKLNKVFFMHKRSFYSPITIKLVDDKNEKPLIFDVYL
jgi:hypothetical protein